MEMTELVMNGLAGFKEAKAKAAPVAAAKPSGLKCDLLFGMMNKHLEDGNGADIIKKCGAVYGWEITMKKGQKPVAVFDCDLKTMPGYVKKGAPKNPDATFTMTDADFEAVCQGKLNPQTAFMTGKMKIKGNMAKAGKFTPDLFPPPTEENLAKFMNAAKL